MGISIKGGKDQNLPILVSKVCRDEDDDHLYIGDAIVKGNFPWFIFYSQNMNWKEVCFCN